MTQCEIAIAGGGIGGLAAALAIARRGLSVTVLEKAGRFGEIGAGIQLGPNAFHCFDALGIGEAARGMAVYIDRLRLMDALSGAEIAHVDLGEAFRAHFGNPYAVVHRGELHRVLLEACEGEARIALRTRAEVTGYAQDATGVHVVLGDGETLRAGALIGADGLWSRVRAQLVGDGPPRVSGHTTYRSVIPVDKMPEDLRWNAATLWAGPKCHIVHYPLSDWRLFNLVVTYHNDAPEPVAGKPVDKAEVRRGFEHVCDAAQGIIEIGEDWKLWVLCDRDPTDAWIDRRVTLLGDAAHPMMQYMAQGACMAMEDAVYLGACLERADGDVTGAFRAYRAERAVRTARVVMASRAIGDFVYHPHGVQARVRDQVLASWSAEEYRHRLDWLYGYDPRLAGAR